ncbi:MAG: hypothetical protein QXG91_03830 [Candidatus Aenigmatarchaeota archaeon]
MVPSSPQKPPDLIRDRSRKVSQILNFIRRLTIKIPPDIFPDIPAKEREISFTEKDLEKIKKRLKSVVGVDILLKFINKKQSISEFQTNFITNIKQFNILPRQWKKCLIGYPQLFSQSPETIKNNIETTAQLLGISKEKYLRAALDKPQLFSLSPETMFAKFSLYKMFVNESNEYILNFLLNNPLYLTYAPERIMAFYVLSKLVERPLKFSMFATNLSSFPKNILTPERYQNIFRPLYDYFRYLFERRRKIKRKVSNAEKEAQTTISHAQKIIEYFGPKEQLTLTPEQVQKIQNLAQRIKEKLEKKENKKT